MQSLLLLLAWPLPLGERQHMPLPAAAAAVACTAWLLAAAQPGVRQTESSCSPALPAPAALSPTLPDRPPCQVGVSAAARIKKSCLCLCTNGVSVDQRKYQFEMWTNIQAGPAGSVGSVAGLFALAGCLRLCGTKAGSPRAGLGLCGRPGWACKEHTQALPM